MGLTSAVGASVRSSAKDLEGTLRPEWLSKCKRPVLEGKMQASPQAARQYDGTLTI